MIRATTGGVLKSYRRNLMNSFIARNKAQDTVLTQRNFNSYAEDPTSAARAFKLRKARMTVQSQYSVCTDTHKKFQTGWSSLEGISKLIDTETAEPMKTLTGTTLSMLNDPTGDAREQLTKVLDQISQTIVQNLNQKYGENFIFSGADGHNVPFEIKDDKLYYRGVPVDAAVPNVVMDGGAPMGIDPATGLVDANGTTYAEDAFIAGENGPELILGKAGSTVFPADETDRIIDAVTNNYDDYSTSYTLAASAAGAGNEDGREEQTKHITLEIAGGSPIEVSGGSGTSKEDIVEILVANLRPALLNIVKDEIFEEGDGSYEH